jgi:dihydrofolate reductase
MRTVIVEAEVALDGINDSENPAFWGQVFKFHTPDVAEYLSRLLFGADALLMGRSTYQAFAQVWPTRTGKDADRINEMPKHVASHTLEMPLAWNATLLEGDVAKAIGALRQQPGKALVQYGVGPLTQTMLQHGLVDEIRLLVFPFVAGRGRRIFDQFPPMNLTLLDTVTFASGALALHYRPEHP